MKKRKLPLSEEQQGWLTTQMAKVTSPERVNPCVAIFGIGPEGKKCRTCALLYRSMHSRCYLKCRLRKHTNGPGSDHKARWPACAKYSEEQQPK